VICITLVRQAQP